MRSLAAKTTRLRIPPENDGQENIQMIRYGGNICTNITALLLYELSLTASGTIFFKDFIIIQPLCLS